MNRQRLRLILKYLLYVLVIFFAFIAQTTPGVLSFCGVRPTLVLPACICIAVYEGEYVGGLLGALGGLLCDFCADSIFGFNSILFVVLCCAAGLGFIYLIRSTFTNVLMISLAALFLRALIEFFFSYVIWGHEALSGLFYMYVAPSAVWSAAFTPIFYFIARGIHRGFESADEREAGF